MRALYTAASGMAAQQTRLDSIANNLANVSTSGYKKSREAFSDLYYQELTRGGQGVAKSRVDVGSGVRLNAVEKDFAQGAIIEDGNPLHAAINGKGSFFVVESVTGERLFTRDGSFSLDAQGGLITASGLTVSNIQIPQGAESVQILDDGSVNVRMAGEANSTSVGQIEVARFVNPAGLRALGGNLFAQSDTSGDPTAVTPADGVQIRGGALEHSNVDIAQELVLMIETQRSYELNSKVIQAADDTLGIATNLRR